MKGMKAGGKKLPGSPPLGLVTKEVAQACSMEEVQLQSESSFEFRIR